MKYIVREIATRKRPLRYPHFSNEGYSVMSVQYFKDEFIAFKGKSFYKYFLKMLCFPSVVDKLKIVGMDEILSPDFIYVCGKKSNHCFFNDKHDNIIMLVNSVVTLIQIFDCWNCSHYQIVLIIRIFFNYAGSS